MAKIEMTFQKSEKIKNMVSCWDDVGFTETNKFYKVIMDEGILLETLLKRLPEYIDTRKFTTVNK